MPIYLTKEDILLINKKTIDRHGGRYAPPNNIFNENALDYLIDVVQSAVFGQPIYPELHEKAGVYLFNINDNHVFHDGNKRTGLGAFLLFLEINGYQLKSQLSKIDTPNGNTIPQKGDTSNKILKEFIWEVAKGKIDLANCQKWIKHNMRIRPPPSDDKRKNT